MFSPNEYGIYSNEGISWVKIMGEFEPSLIFPCESDKPIAAAPLMVNPLNAC